MLRNSISGSQALSPVALYFWHRQSIYICSYSCGYHKCWALTIKGSLQAMLGRSSLPSRCSAESIVSKTVFFGSHFSNHNGLSWIHCKHHPNCLWHRAQMLIAGYTSMPCIYVCHVLTREVSKVLIYCRYGSSSWTGRLRLQSDSEPFKPTELAWLSSNSKLLSSRACTTPD